MMEIQTWVMITTGIYNATSNKGFGNYWYDWANNNDTNDHDHNGIVDWLYRIPVQSLQYSDLFPLKNITKNKIAIPPAQLTAVAGDGKVILHWKAPDPGNGITISSYKIYRRTDFNTEKYLANVPVGTDSYIDLSVTNGIIYHYYIIAINDGVKSAPSEEVTAKPENFMP